ncbi:putative pentatricopeptide repeat-containing protein [Senna tora]|uniref:Putative pentatricopeptide repeat-containing protein n=1 Tax=Senna tora TaxID=362788 RepID=A0A834X9X3_9FABA|nr:putative pentatricopeptide repeat-containing protein [Senna tora]
MLSGYVGADDGYETEAIDLFIRMQSVRKTVGIDEVTLNTMLNLASKLSVAIYGRQVHSYMVKTGNDGSIHAVSSLIDMHSKCGLFGEAWNVFSGCEGKVDLISKSAMLAVFFREGKMDMEKFFHLVTNSDRDAVIYYVMVAAGYAHHGRAVFFNSMEEDHNILPENDHYACMVDVYGRANQLDKEVEIMREIPIEMDATILGAFLNACWLQLDIFGKWCSCIYFWG